MEKTARRTRIKLKIRKTIRGTASRPRLSVFRSNKQVFAQLIDDDNRKTLLQASSLDKKNPAKGKKVDQSKVVGKELASKALEAGIKTVVFDRNGYLYHGRVKALADGAREGGLTF